MKIYVYINTYMFICILENIYVYVNIYIYTCIYIYIVHICMYINTFYDIPMLIDNCARWATFGQEWEPHSWDFLMGLSSPLYV